MGKFRKKGEELKAWMWFADGDPPVDGNGNPIVQPYRRYRTDGRDACRCCGRRYVVHGWIEQGESGVLVCPGDWLFRDHAGMWCRMDGRQFTEIYEPVPEPWEKSMKGKKE